MLLAESFLERNGTLFQVLATVLVAALGGIGGWWLRSRERATKTFDYRRRDDITILTSDERPEGLKVVFGHVEVTNPFISQIRFKNTGKRVIETEDFLEPITILRTGAKILDFNIVKQSERSLFDGISSVRPMDGQDMHEVIQIEPRTLNPGDSFEAQIVYDGDHTGEPMVTCRVKDQTRKMQIYPTRQELSYTNLIGPMLPLFFVLFGFGIYSLATARQVTPGFVFLLSAVALGVLAVWASVRRRRSLFARLTAGQPPSY